MKKNRRSRGWKAQNTFTSVNYNVCILDINVHGGTLPIWIVQKGNEFYLISATFAKTFDNVHFCYCRTLFDEVVNVFKNYTYVTFIKQEIFGRKTSCYFETTET